MGCVTVKLTEEGQKHKQITMCSLCSKCKGNLPKSVTMQKDTYCLSFGKYLELRFHSPAYRCRDIRDEIDSTTVKSSENTVCTHSLHHDHIQYFSCNGILASFSYTPIEVWEISLPACKIQLKIPKSNETIASSDEIKAFSSRGHDIFVVIYDRLALLLSETGSNEKLNPLLIPLKNSLNNDQLAFKEKVGIVHELLAKPLSYAYEIQDGIFMMKKTLIDFIEIWTQRLADASAQYRNICAQQTIKSETSANTITTPSTVTLVQTSTSTTVSTTTSAVQQPNDLDLQEGLILDSGTICTEEFRSDSESPMDVTKSNVFLSREVSSDSQNSTILKTNSSDVNTIVSNQVTERDSKSSTSSFDKKSVKTILRELLPGEKPVQSLPSPIPSSENLSLAIGCVPVLVHDQDFSSVIAYTLASFDYLRKLDSLKYCDTHRKSYDAAATDTEDAIPSASSKENEKEKKSKTTSQTHVETSFQDTTTGTQFTCKVYFARDFDLLRSKLLTLASSVDDYVKIPFYRRHASFDSDAKSTSVTSTNQSSNINSDQFKPEEKYEDAQKKDLDRVRAAFIRSLSKSVRWEARGGKSGSKFCKTLGKY